MAWLFIGKYLHLVDTVQTINLMRRFFQLIAGFFFFLCPMNGQKNDVNRIDFPQKERSFERTILRFPSISGYMTLKCDFHLHTVFSDGDVWPVVRVDEAWREGLDAISITDHIEYRPKKDYVSGNENASYLLAKDRAKALDVLLIPGTEITRNQPDPGHYNALFVTDASLLNVPDPREALRAANRQNAFVIWNHPGWAVDTCRMYEIQKEMLAEKMVHGIEIFNGFEYYPRALSWCVDNRLTIFSNTDMHQVKEYSFGTSLRNMTLVFATERTPESIREALFAGRTLAYAHGLLGGTEALLKAFFLASVECRLLRSSSQGDDYVLINRTDLPYSLKIHSGILSLPAQREVPFRVAQGSKTLSIEILNMLSYENKTTEVTISL